MFGGVADVEPGEIALAFARLGLFVVEPDGRAEPAGGLGGERHGVARGVAEPGGDLAVAGVDRGSVPARAGGGVGFGEHLGAAVGIGEPVEDPAVRGRGARDGLDVPEVRAAEAEADRGRRAESVGGLQDDQAAAGADERGSGAQELLEGGVEVTGAGEAFGELVEGGEIGDHPRQAVLDQRARSGNRCRGRCGGCSGGNGRRSLRDRGNCWIDSSHFRQMRGAHGVRLSTWCDSLYSIANPQIVLRRHQ